MQFWPECLLSLSPGQVLPAANLHICDFLPPGWLGYSLRETQVAAFGRMWRGLQGVRLMYGPVSNDRVWPVGAMGHPTVMSAGQV